MFFLKYIVIEVSFNTFLLFTFLSYNLNNLYKYIISSSVSSRKCSFNLSSNKFKISHFSSKFKLAFLATLIPNEYFLNFNFFDFILISLSLNTSKGQSFNNFGIISFINFIPYMPVLSFLFIFRRT